jgi:hypothetical protein
MISHSFIFKISLFEIIHQQTNSTEFLTKSPTEISKTKFHTEISIKPKQISSTEFRQKTP